MGKKASTGDEAPRQVLAARSMMAAAAGLGALAVAGEVERQDWTAYQVSISRLMRANQDVVFIAVYDDRDALRAHTLNPELVEVDESILSDRRMVRALVRSIDDGGIATVEQTYVSAHIVAEDSEGRVEYDSGKAADQAKADQRPHQTVHQKEWKGNYQAKTRQVEKRPAAFAPPSLKPRKEHGKSGDDQEEQRPGTGHKKPEIVGYRQRP